MKQQHTLMKFDPATGAEKPYPSHAEQWREWHGTEAWLFNPWTGATRLAGDVGTDVFGLLVLPPGEPLYAAAQSAQCGAQVLRQGAIMGAGAQLASTEARYRDLLDRLGVQGHVGAVEEIAQLRARAGLE